MDPKKFLDFIRRSPCLICRSGTYHEEIGAWICDPAHVQTKGSVGTTGDVGNIVPLCRQHHSEQHSIGIKTFQTKYKIDMKARALEYAELFVSEDLISPF